eukprot:13228459-Alexandrium_andersonii.AAC.1
MRRRHVPVGARRAAAVGAGSNEQPRHARSRPERPGPRWAYQCTARVRAARGQAAFAQLLALRR